MEDFIFGTLANDELKLIHHRAVRRGLQHNYQLSPLDPSPDQPVTITVQVGCDLGVEQVACYYTVDGSLPVGEHGVALHGQVIALKQVEVVWDTLSWGYLTIWQGVIPPQPEGAVVRYRIGAWAEGTAETFADWPDVQLAIERATSAFFRNEPMPDIVPGDLSGGHTFTYRVDRLGPPTWARDAVIYHVFVDRFYPGDGRAWLQTDDLRDICGGTLWGVRDKLDYIADLGVTCIWLSPIFVSPSHHGYDATDYYHVEPRLGGENALRALIDAAHARGIRILLDLVCNHLSDQHPVFQEAYTDPGSPYRDWFIFDSSDIGYRTFFGVPSMPQLNVENPAARQWMIDIACFWLREFDVDGYRLDYALGPGPSFWSDFWAACKAAKPDSFCFGEIVDTPQLQRTYIGRLDGCLDFQMGDVLRKTFGRGQMTEEMLERFLERHLAFFPPNFLMPTFLDNHDMDRFIYIAAHDITALQRAAAFQMRLPGPPIIYYGTEVGLSQPCGKADNVGAEISRTLMLWGDDQDRGLLEFYKTIIRQRQERRRSGRP